MKIRIVEDPNMGHWKYKAQKRSWRSLWMWETIAHDSTIERLKQAVEDEKVKPITVVETYDA